MNLRHIRLIIKREYVEKLRSPGFIIGTILGIAVFMGLSFLPILFKVFVMCFALIVPEIASARALSEA